jgi:hypothetical protein
MTFFKWASFSLLGHVALSEVIAALPFFLVMLFLNYSEGTLSLEWALWIFGVSVVMGVVGAVLIWYTISLPLIKRRNNEF